MCPPIQVGTENIPVCMSALWTDISTPSVYQDNETGSGGTEATGNLSYNMFLIAEYLPGEENTVADKESRNMKDRCDWMLNPCIFRQVEGLMGRPVCILSDKNNY